MRLFFHGAAGDVTGSCHLLETDDGRRILIDCGLRQGGNELDEENAAPFGFDAAAIDLVLLTHAHLDHTGRLPLLFKRGFRGEIIATAATFDLARLVMLDAAHMHEEAASRGVTVAHKRDDSRIRPALYSLADAACTMGLFGRRAVYRAPIKIAPGMHATFFEAGHILGSASILLEAAGSSASVVFSGDLGNIGRPLLPGPEAPQSASFVVMESTYGDREHRPFDESMAEFQAVVRAAIAAGGNVLIPTFALDRAQEILYVLRQGIGQGLFPETLPVFVDSPMAVSATNIYEHYPEAFEPAVAAMFRQGEDPFRVPGLRLVRDRADSIAINDIPGGAIIMAGSGMCTGGRILHHLKHNVWKDNASVIFVGYAAQGTPARRMIDGAGTIRLFGEDVPVRARIHTINGFSAHADRRELVAWQHKIAGKARTFLVHGERAAMTELARHLDPPVTAPELHQSFEL